jgi:Protein of unknown function (DUF2934)
MAKRADRPQARPKTTRAARVRKPNGSNGANGSEGSIENMDVPHLESAPNEDDIRVRAYHRYLERGAGDGADFDDWLEAEKDLKVAHN